MRPTRHITAGTVVCLLPLYAAWAACAAGCAATAREPPRPAPVAVAPLDGPESARLVAAAEARTLPALASVDARLSARMHIEPSEEELGKAAMGAIVHGDEGVAVVKGATDLFSFDVRARRIDEERALLARPPALADAAPAPSPILRPRLEWELLSRLVMEEQARLGEEKGLPRSASELVRGVVSTWAPVASTTEAKERDTWLARRLDEVQESLAHASLRPVEVTELEGALDPLERLADPLGFPRVQAAMTRLRVALGQLRGPATGTAGWERLEHGLEAHIGMAPEPHALRAMLDELEARLRKEALAALEGRSRDEAAAARESAVRLLLVTGSCGDPTGSRVRAFAPPPERAAICGALQSLRYPKSEAELAAVVALADDVTVAIWASEINGEGRDPYAAVGAHPLLSHVPPELKGPLMRSVAVRPLLPLGVALMAKLIATQGPEERARRVARWLAFGDAPLDVVSRELAF